MSQQTALDWFIENLPTRFKNAILNECSQEIEQAKAMEKEQIIEAYQEGEYISNKKTPAEQYYNETYQSSQDKPYN